jgi:hypothetical protein
LDLPVCPGISQLYSDESHESHEYGISPDWLRLFESRSGAGLLRFFDPIPVQFGFERAKSVIACGYVRFGARGLWKPRPHARTRVAVASGMSNLGSNVQNRFFVSRGFVLSHPRIAGVQRLAMALPTG